MSNSRDINLVHNLSEHKDLFNIGAWLDANGHFKDNRDLKKAWWLHSIVCLII